MKTIYSNDILNSEIELVATVGFFDGVHLGHRFLIDEVKKKANEQHRKSAVITFASHPRKILHSDFQPLLLTTFDEKMEQLKTTGIDYCIVLDFDIQMSKLSAYEFLKQIVYQRYNIRTLFAGHDHKFGHNRAEGFSEYHTYGHEIGLEVIQTTKYSLPEYSHISSSEIRNALKTGELLKANKLLSYNYALSGKVTSGFQVGRKLGFPTANIELLDTEKLIPASGVYAVKVQTNNSQFGGMLNIGNRPTLDNSTQISIEVNIFDFDEDIYNQEIKVAFIQKIRNEIKFDSLENLILQLENDKKTAMEILNQNEK